MKGEEGQNNILNLRKYIFFLGYTFEMRVILILFLVSSITSQSVEEDLPTPPTSSNYSLHDFYTQLNPNTASKSLHRDHKIVLSDLSNDDLTQLCLDMGYEIDLGDVGHGHAVYVKAALECLRLGEVQYSEPEYVEEELEAEKKVEVEKKVEEVDESDPPPPHTLSSEEIFEKSQEGYFCQEEPNDPNEPNDIENENEMGSAVEPMGSGPDATLFNPSGLTLNEFTSSFLEKVKADLNLLYTLLFPKILQERGRVLGSRVKDLVVVGGKRLWRFGLEKFADMNK